MNNLSIYIHIPFCQSKCHYCDFLSFPLDGGVPDKGDCPAPLGTVPEPYAQATSQDLITSSASFTSHTISTIFFGGGTPSLLSIDQLHGILTTLQQNFTLTQNTNLSIETNPETLAKPYLTDLKNLGFNRISLGVQSFNDTHLKSIGRRHSAETAINAIKWAKEAGFKDINLDLMFALPNQSVADFEKCLETAINLPITHISCYALTIEEGTPMENHITDENLDRQMYALAKEKLASAGFKHYEVSNWAKAGYECRHNTGYWTGREYLGVGLGASSYFQNKRMKKTDDLDEYTNGNFEFIVQEELDTAAKMSEFMLLGLRMSDGISASDFKARFGRDVFEVFGSQLSWLFDEALLAQEGGKIRLTSRGLDIANTVFVEFL